MFQSGHWASLFEVSIECASEMFIECASRTSIECVFGILPLSYSLGLIKFHLLLFQRVLELKCSLISCTVARKGPLR